jgi:hypothetical protein
VNAHKNKPQLPNLRPATPPTTRNHTNRFTQELLATPRFNSLLLVARQRCPPTTTTDLTTPRGLTTNRTTTFDPTKRDGCFACDPIRTLDPTQLQWAGHRTDLPSDRRRHYPSRTLRTHRRQHSSSAQHLTLPTRTIQHPLKTTRSLHMQGTTREHRRNPPLTNPTLLLVTRPRLTEQKHP